MLMGSITVLNICLHSNRHHSNVTMKPFHNFGGEVQFLYFFNLVKPNLLKLSSFEADFILLCELSHTKRI